MPGEPARKRRWLRGAVSYDEVRDHSERCRGILERPWAARGLLRQAQKLWLVRMKAEVEARGVDAVADERGWSASVRRLLRAVILQDGSGL